jgi:copper chaperone
VSAPGPELTRVILGVRGMDTEGARVKVRAAVAAVAGVTEVERVGEGELMVHYDASEVTVMDIIRAVRRVGFLAGMA